MRTQAGRLETAEQQPVLAFALEFVSEKVLGRDDVGVLAPQMAADFIAIDLEQPSLAGAAVHDPVAALLFCHINKVDYSFINGRRVIDQGQLTTLDLPQLVQAHNQAVVRLLSVSSSHQ